MHLRYPIAAALSSLLLFAPRADAEVLLPTGFVNDTLLLGLTEPTSMAFLPDGRLLITEQRTGNVRLFVKGHIAATDPIKVVPDLVADHYERGLQGIAVDPRWPTHPYVYLYYDRSGGSCRLVRYRASGDISEPAGEGIVLGDSLLLLDDIPDANGGHNAGCLRFGPGNYLFVSLGDDEVKCGAADSTSLRGTILRLDVSRLPDAAGGQVPRALITPDVNPLSTADSNARLVWAYGLRNPWRYVIDPPTGALYTAEVGLETYDELDEILPGDYLGWPFREGPQVSFVPGCTENGGAGANQYKAPVVALFHEGGPQAVNTAGMYRAVPGADSNWPQAYAGFWGDVLYGEYYSGYLRRLKRLSGIWITPPPAPGQPNETDWAAGLMTAVEFLVGPDGSLWWLQQFNESYEPGSGMLERIRWTNVTLSVGPAGSRPPAKLLVAPNPSRGATLFALHLPAKKIVTLGLYDVSGRRVRALFRGEAPAGESDYEWDGRDDRGHLAAAGLYFARVQAAGEAPRTAALLRLR